MGQQLLAGFFLQEPWWRRDVQRRVGHRGLVCTPQLATPPHLPLAGAATPALPTTAVGVRAAPTSSAYSATVPAARSIAGFQSGFRHGFNVGWAEGYQARQQDEPELRKGTNKYTRAASSDWWESDDHGGCDAGDKKKQQRKTCRAKEWSKQYHKDNPVDPEKFPRMVAMHMWNESSMMQCRVCRHVMEC